MNAEGRMAGGPCDTLRAMRGDEALCLRLQHVLLVVIVVIACLCLVSMAGAQPVRAVEDLALIDDESRIRAAVIEAVRARMGADVTVTLADPRVRLTGMLPVRLVAMPDIGAQAGASVRFVLFDRDAATHPAAAVSTPHGPRESGRASASPSASPSAATKATGKRIGSVDVHVTVQAGQLRATGPIARGAEISAADVESVIADAGRVPLRALPPAARALGAKATRDIAAGQIITSALLLVSPLVKSGDEVRTRVRMGGFEARGTAVAAQSGALGDEVLVVNADSRRRLKGRVVGEREVEVLH